MQDDVQAVLQKVDDQLTALRSAILSNHLARVEFHTAELRKLLSQLATLLTKPSPRLFRKLRDLHAQAHGAQCLVRSARRTVHALIAVHRSFHDSEPQALTEQR